MDSQQLGVRETIGVSRETIGVSRETIGVSISTPTNTSTTPEPTLTPTEPSNETAHAHPKINQHMASYSFEEGEMPESEEGEIKRFRVGYALPARKLNSFMVPSFIAFARDRSIDFIPIDISTPLTHQTPFDCIIHKINTHQWKLNLHDFTINNPNVTIIDPPSTIERLHNRISMLEFITRLNIPNLSIPNQVLVPDSSMLESVVAAGGLDFPVIAKPVVADGSTKSHKMSLVLNREGLTNLDLDPPVVLQQFVNHGGVIFKVYVAEDYVKCVKRRSLPDISAEMMEKMSSASGGVMGFSQISNSSIAGDDRRNTDDGVELPAPEFVAEVAKELRQTLGLHLFNFDLIRDDNRKGFLVIDINYFPGYEKLPNYETVMTNFFLKIMKSQKEKKKKAVAAAEHGEFDRPLE